MVLINVANSRAGLTGLIAQRCLEECGIIVDMIKLPYDKKPALVTSGIRLGTPIVTKRGMGVEEMDRISALIDAILKEVKIISDSEYEIDESFKDEMRSKVEDLCGRFPMC
jgi:glycine hydroxymethyltransferase